MKLNNKTINDVHPLSRTLSTLALVVLTTVSAQAQGSQQGAGAVSATGSSLGATLGLVVACLVEMGLFYAIATILSRILIDRKYPPIAARIATLISVLALFVSLTVTVVAMVPLLQTAGGSVTSPVSSSPSA